MAWDELENILSSSPLQPLPDASLHDKGIELWIKRDDLIHAVVSGNKWRKLKYVLRHAYSLEARRIISMGGKYSNHLHALAFVGQQLQLPTSAFIRGERLETDNATVQDLRRWGMRLEFVSRGDYRELRRYTRHDSLPNWVNGDYWLPEGGANRQALTGIAELVQEIDMEYDVLCAPCGSGTTLAGLIEAAPPNVLVLGIATLKGASFLNKNVTKLLSNNRGNWRIVQDYHFGGFARSTPTLQRFIERFRDKYAIELEPIYTGKMFYALYDLIQRGYFSPGQRIVAIHTGGLQGKRS